MARVLGVIAEYNPFHRGHAYHLRRARELSGAEYVVVVMSSCFTQRGEAALLSPSDRARMALQCGADAVFALPAVWAVRDAEHFALGGVALLAGLGCDVISFGTESDALPLMERAAAMLEAPDAAFSAAVQAQLSAGLAYPAALAAAMEAALPGAGDLLSRPNSTLGVCYLRAMRRLNAPMTVVTVQRESSYHDTALTGCLPSATATRSAILRGDWRSAEGALPPEPFAILRSAAANGRIHRPDALDQALLYRLRMMSAAGFAALPDISEGIEHRLMDAVAGAVTREELLLRAKTRRYPHARLSRLATHALLGLEAPLLSELALPESAWLLGFRQDARPLFSHFRAHAGLPILSKASDHDRSAPWFAIENRAYDLWALGAGLPSGLAFTQGVAVVE